MLIYFDCYRWGLNRILPLWWSSYKRRRWSRLYGDKRRVSYRWCCYFDLFKGRIQCKMKVGFPIKIMYSLKYKIIKIYADVPVQENFTDMLYSEFIHCWQKSLYMPLSSPIKLLIIFVFKFQRDVFQPPWGVHWPIQWRMCSIHQCGFNNYKSDPWVKQIISSYLILLCLRCITICMSMISTQWWCFWWGKWYKFSSQIANNHHVDAPGAGDLRK